MAVAALPLALPLGNGVLTDSQALPLASEKINRVLQSVNSSGNALTLTLGVARPYASWTCDAVIYYLYCKITCRIK